eukprot:131548_1
MSQFRILEISGEFESQSCDSITSIATSKKKTNQIITGSKNGTMDIWNMTQTQKTDQKNHHISYPIVIGTIIKTIQCHDSSIVKVDTDDDSQYALTGSKDKTMKLWNLDTFALQHIFNGHKQEISSISLSNDAQTICSSTDKTVRIWNKMGQIANITKHRKEITSIITSPNSKYLIIAFIGFIKIYHIDINNRKVGQIDSSHKIGGHEHAKYKIAISPDSTCMASVDETGKVKLHQTADASLVWKINANKKLNDLCFAMNKFCLCAVSNHSIIIWDLITKTTFCELDILRNSIINCISFPPGDTIFIGCDDGKLRALSIIDNEENKQNYILVDVKFKNYANTLSTLSVLLDALHTIQNFTTSKSPNARIVINHSWIWPKNNEINDIVSNTAALGAITIVGAGNEHKNIKDYSPQSAKDVITVGAYEDQGPSWIFGVHVIGIWKDSNYPADVYAPGVNLPWFRSKTVYTGTSYAAAIVSGIVVNILSLHKDLKYSEVKNVLFENSWRGHGQRERHVLFNCAKVKNNKQDSRRRLLISNGDRYFRLKSKETGDCLFSDL